MPSEVNKDPLHGLTLEMILTALVETLGWKILSRIIEVRCFYNDPSIKSSLTFLRKTPWARKKVEDLFLVECPDYYNKSKAGPKESGPKEDIWY